MPLFNMYNKLLDEYIKDITDLYIILCDTLNEKKDLAILQEINNLLPYMTDTIKFLEKMTKELDLLS